MPQIAPKIFATNVPNFEQNLVLAELLTTSPEFLRSRLEVVYFAPTETIYDVGDPINYVYFPLDSVVSCLAVLKDGTTVETSMIGHDSMVGITNAFSDRRSQNWFQMCLGGRLVRLHIEDLISCFSDSRSLAQRVLHYSSSLIAHISQRAICNARHSVTERFCCWLLMLDDRSNERSLRITHELVATRLGTRRAGITSAAHSLLREHLIAYKRGLLKICDRSGIERLACECYHHLKLKSRTSSGPLTLHRTDLKHELRSADSFMG